MNTDGTGLKKLTNDPGQYNYPKWSPDGGWLLYRHYPSAEMGERPKLVYLSRDGS
ncbi:MAG TPA: hypothetical protein VMM56_15475 [Planctomycetaceae bacterium]|nr:hypothetical protein [Planctomycetaceae bacterium]